MEPLRIAAVLALSFTAAIMSSGLWLFLGITVFLGAQKANEGILKAATDPFSSPISPPLQSDFHVGQAKTTRP